MLGAVSSRSSWPDRARKLSARKSIQLLLLGLAGVGYAMCAVLLIQHGVGDNGGEGGVDVLAYWTAGRHLLAGEDLYGLGIGGPSAFLYPPVMAQLFMPLSLLPFPVVLWIWRAVLLVALRIAVGNWRNAGLAMLLWPPVITELDAGNVHLILAAAVAETIRGRAASLVPVSLTKFASLAAVPLAIRVDPRGFLLGTLGAAIAVLVSVVIATDLWAEYLAFVLAPPAAETDWFNIGERFPLGIRLGLAAVVALLAIRWSRLAAVATTLALPVLWIHGLSTLVAVTATPVQRGDTAAIQAHHADGDHGGVVIVHSESHEVP